MSAFQSTAVTDPAPGLHGGLGRRDLDVTRSAREADRLCTTPWSIGPDQTLTPWLRMWSRMRSSSPPGSAGAEREVLRKACRGASGGA